MIIRALKFHSAKGSVQTEYVLALVILVPVFMVAAALLFQRGDDNDSGAVVTRSDSSVEVVGDMVPCNGNLSGASCM